MKNLIEVSKIVTRKKVRKIEIFDDHTLKNRDSKFNQFYEMLMDGRFRNDRDAATTLYNCSPTDDRYRQLKSRFRKRLLNTLFFLDVNVADNSNYERAYYTANKDWALVKILLANDSPHTAATLARQILLTAQKYKFSDLIINCARILRQYCMETENERDFEEYDKTLKQYTDIQSAEIRSEEMFQRVMLNYFKPKEENDNLEAKIDVYCDGLVSLSEMYDSPVIWYNMFLIWTYRYEMLQDYDGMIEVCERAEKYMADNPNYYQEDKQTTFYLKKMSAFLHLRDYKRGKLNAEKCLANFEEGNENWFSFMEYYLLLAMHTENYINALAILSRVLLNTKFKKLPIESRERWNMYEVYLNYVVEVFGAENPILRRQSRRAFKISKFLGTPPMYSKDLRIFSIFMLIAQILFQIEEKKWGDAEDSIERLKNYSNRQLKKEDNFRLIQFIRLLQQLSKANFDVSEMTNTEKYTLRLRTNPMFFRGLTHEIEVIPFDKLWQNIIERINR